MNTHWNSLLQILANHEENDTPILVIISGISEHADVIRQKETHEMLYRIVDAIIMLNKHTSEAVKYAAMVCLNIKFPDETREVARRVKELQEQKTS